MRVAMLVGVLMFNVIAGLYQSDWGFNASLEASLNDGREVRALDFPVPPSWP